MIILKRTAVEGHEMFELPKEGKVQGIFTLQAVKNGRVIRERKFKNIVTDQGLNWYGNSTMGSYMVRCYVGTGTSVPAATDTQLAAPYSWSGSVTSTSNAGIAPNWNPTIEFTFDWPLGNINANLTEIGIGSTAANSNLFSRALILDASGVPTAFPVGSDEQLRVVYSFSLYPSLVDFTTTQKIGATTYDVTVRPYGVQSTSYWSAFNSVSTAASINSAYTTGYTGPLVPYNTVNLTGSLGSGNTSDAAYVNGSFTRNSTLTCGPTNMVGNIRTIMLGRSCFRHQVQYTPAIPKTGTQNLIIPSSVSWGRR